MQYTTNCIKNEHLPLNSNWVGTIFTTKGVKGFGYSILKDHYTPFEWALEFTKAIKQLNKKDKASKYIGGLLQYKDRFIAVCTVDKHRDTVVAFSKEVLFND